MKKEATRDDDFHECPVDDLGGGVNELEDVDGTEVVSVEEEVFPQTLPLPPVWVLKQYMGLFYSVL